MTNECVHALMKAFTMDWATLRLRGACLLVSHRNVGTRAELQVKAAARNAAALKSDDFTSTLKLSAVTQLDTVCL